MPAVQPDEVAGVTVKRVALTVPMLLVDPKAVAHSPTLSALAFAGPVRSNSVFELTLTEIFFVLSAVVRAFLFEEDRTAENENIVPSMAMAEAETEVTFPDAVASLAGTLKRRLVPLPEVGGRKLRLPVPLNTLVAVGAPTRPRQFPVAAESMTVVASRAPSLAFVPEAVIQEPLATSFRGTLTVAVIFVLEVMSTVVCPLSALRTSKVLPETRAIWPVAAGGAKAGVRELTVVVVFLDAAAATPPGRIATAKAKAPKADTSLARRIGRSFLLIRSAELL